MSDRTVRRRVSVVIVNYKGSEDTIVCLEHLRTVDWPDVEVIVVDNASGDGSVDVVTARCPEARVLALPTNVGFAGGCNSGAEIATGEYVAFLNNDARPDVAWLRAAVDAMARDGSVGCVASKILDWEGEVVDYVGSYLAFFGHGFKRWDGAPDSPAFDDECDTLFASGAAMVLPHAVFTAVGGFDDRYFMFFEDVDLGWRLWLLGYRVRYVPSSIAFHRHHRSMEGLGSWKEHYLLERNALFTIFKNYDDEHLRAALPAALLLAARRATAMGELDPHAFDLARGTSDADDETATVAPKIALASLYAVDSFVESLPDLAESRKTIQARRRRGDSEILPLFREPFEPIPVNREYLDGYHAIVDALDLEPVFSGRNKILVLTPDVLGPRMAGPAIRAWQIAKALGKEHEVILASTVACNDLSHPDFTVRYASGMALHHLVAWCDVIVFQGLDMWTNPVLKDNEKIIVTDIYDPFHLEQLEATRELDHDEGRVHARSTLAALNQQLDRGDLFLCASDKQRDFWLGQLSGLGRINPATYRSDERLDNLVQVVPFGVSDQSPVHTREVLKGVVPGIGRDDKVILWGGGVYNWFDPLTLIRAVDKLRARLPEVRLFFLGLGHPNPNVPAMRAAAETKQLSADLGLTGTHVFFNEGWVAYEDRQNYLLEADIGVSTHLDHIETEFSFRTRILDYLWASLPVVATAGDSFGDLIERDGFGLTVPPGDSDALEAALFVLLDDAELYERCAQRSGEVAQTFLWSTVLEPLVRFCRRPRRAADLADPAYGDALTPLAAALRPGFLRDLKTIVTFVLDGDFRTMASKAKDRLRRAAAAR